MVLLITQLYASSRHSRCNERFLLRSDRLILDNTLTPLYQERVASLSFNTEHTSEQFDEDDDDGFEEWLMTGTGRRA